MHGGEVVTVTKEDMRYPCEDIPEKYYADGFVTDQKNVPLAVFTADCVPLLLQDKKAKVIGAIHCGWKSTAADIEKNAVETMTDLGAAPQNIYAAIGPAIGKECFETGQDVVDAMEALIGETAAAYIRKREKYGKYLVDLQGIVKERLIQLGLDAEHVKTVPGCTMCEPARFWSHRYTKGHRGSQANIIMLR